MPRQPMHRQTGDGAAVKHRFPRSFGSLEAVFGFVDEFFVAREMDRKHLYAVCVAIEELITNMVKYEAGGAGEILLDLKQIDRCLEITLTDVDVDQFDVTDVEGVGLDRPLDERSPGDLGLHLVKRLMDDVAYHLREPDEYDE